MSRVIVPPKDVIEVGRPEPDDYPQQGVSSRAIALAVIGLLGVVVGMATVVPGDENDRPRVTTPPSQMEAPDAPVTVPPSEPAPLALPTEILALQNGWHRLELPAGTYAAPPVANGGLGWLTFTTGRLNIAYTSVEGRLWTPHVLDDDGVLASGSPVLPAAMTEAAHVAVSDEAFVVVVRPPFGDGASWRSEDGENWERIPFEPGEVVVEGVFGGVGDFYALVSDEDESQTVLRLNGRVWSEVTVKGDDTRAEIHSIVVRGGETWAFGAVARRSAAWVHKVDGFIPVELVSGPSGPFIDVRPDGGGGWVASTTFGVSRSPDLRSWLPSIPQGLGVVSIGSIDGTLVGVDQARSEVFALSRDRIDRLEIDGLNEDTPISLTIGGDVAVISAFDDSGGVLWLRGVAPPVIVSPAAITEPTWTRVSSIPLDGPADPVGVQSGEQAFIVIGRQLFPVSRAGVIDPRSSVPAFDSFGRDETGDVYLIEGVRRYRYQGSGLWKSEPIADPDQPPHPDTIASLGGDAGVEAEIGLESENGGLFRRSGTQPAWAPLRPPDDFGGPVSALVDVPDGVVVTVLAGEDGRQAAHFTSDGVDWQKLDGTMPIQRFGVPFIVAEDGSIRLLDRPQIERLTLPEGVGEPIQVLRFVHEIRVLTQTSVVITNEFPVTWHRLPLDPAYGASQDRVALLPGHTVRVVVTANGRLSVLRWG